MESCFCSVGCQCFGPSYSDRGLPHLLFLLLLQLRWVCSAFLIAVFQISFGYSLKTLVFSATPLSAILGSFLRFTLELFDWPIDHRSSHPLLQSAIVFNKCLQGRLCSDRVSSKASQRRSLTCSLPGEPQAGWILVIVWSWGFGSTPSLFCPAAIAWGCFGGPITGRWSLGTADAREKGVGRTS